MSTTRPSPGLAQTFKRSLANLASIPGKDYGGVIDRIDQMMEPRAPGRDAWMWRQAHAALRRRDYGPLLAVAVCLDLQEFVERAPGFISEIARVTNELLLALGQDPATLRPLPRTSGRPSSDLERRTGKSMFQKYGLGYRDAAIGIWLLSAPFTVVELRRLARPKNMYSEMGARKWLESGGRKLLRSLDRAWEDVHGSSVAKPGLYGFMPLTRKVLSEWPDDALATITSINRRKRRAAPMSPQDRE